MAEQLAYLQTIDERKDGGFVSNPFTGLLHIQPSRKESSGGLVDTVGGHLYSEVACRYPRSF
jgi:hypothetical protein